MGCDAVRLLFAIYSLVFVVSMGQAFVWGFVEKDKLTLTCVTFSTFTYVISAFYIIRGVRKSSESTYTMWGKSF